MKQRYADVNQERVSRNGAAKLNAHLMVSREC